MTPEARTALRGTPRIAVVTAVAAGKDRLADPRVDTAGADFIAFVDDRQGHVAHWDQRPLPRWSGDPEFGARRDAKVPKLMPWLLAPGYDFYIWVDGHFTLKMDPVAICRRLFADEGADIALVAHPWRSCVYDEIEVALRLGLDHAPLLQSQADAYRLAHYPERAGLYACGSLVWRRSAGSTRLSLAWWEHLGRFSSRDQISLPVALRATGCRVAPIDGASHLDNPYFEKVGEHAIPTGGRIPPGTPMTAAGPRDHARP